MDNIFEHVDYSGIKKTELYKNEKFHVLLLCLKEGEFLKPHYAKTDAFLVVQEGEIIFYKEDKSFEMRQGDIIDFTAVEKHAVKALCNASLLLVK